MCELGFVCPFCMRRSLGFDRWILPGIIELAFAAGTKNGKVIQIGGKTVICAQRLFETGEGLSFDFGHLAARAADQMVMVGMLMKLVLHAALSKIGGVDEVEAREQIERAVDRGFVKVGITEANTPENFVRAEMPLAFTNGGEDHLALGRKTMTGLSEIVEQF